MLLFLTLQTVHLSASSPTAIDGIIETRRPSPQKDVSILNARNQRYGLSGPLLSELGRLNTFRVEVMGRHQDASFLVMAYRIIDIGGGRRPWVGTLVQKEGQWALKDGEGSPIGLRVSSKTQGQLAKKRLSKLWVFGEKLLTGEIRVRAYGILREAPSGISTTPSEPQVASNPKKQSEKSDSTSESVAPP